MVHFLHIGKTGGTALTQMLKEVHSSRYHFKIHPHEFTLQEVPEGHLAMFFLRNPVDRFVSGFYSRKRKGQPAYDVPWNEAEEKAFHAFETPNALAEALSSDEGKVREQAMDAMKGIRHVNTHFGDWLVSETYLEKHKRQLFYIGFQENFSEDVKQLYKKITRKALKTEIAKSHQAPEKEDKYLSAIAQENLAHWYSEDIQLYQFCKKLAQKVN
ncbi:MAG: sulfotransferase family 2 domain-containing protein [Flavobacteriaceae bacterium]